MWYYFTMKTAIVGIFDSGIGGRSIEKEIKKILPKIKTIYLKDSKNFPYGDKTPVQIRKIALGNTKYLLDRESDLIVVACNTATVHAISHLRKLFPKVNFVGVEPAIKPALEISKKRVIVLSSPMTTKRIQNSLVYKVSSLDLVCAIEKKASKHEINKILENALPKKILKNSDVLVLGCTHFPLIRSKIQKFVGPKVKIIDSGQAVAKRVQYLLELRQVKQ